MGDVVTAWVNIPAMKRDQAIPIRMTARRRRIR